MLLLPNVAMTTTTTGTDPLVFDASPVDGSLALSALVSGVEATLYYRLDWGTKSWELGVGHLHADGTFDRANVYASSAGGGNTQGYSTYVVALPAGKKTFSVVAPPTCLVATNPNDNDALKAPSATGQKAMALGLDAQAAGDGAIAIGSGAHAAKYGAIHLGVGEAPLENAVSRYLSAGADMWSIDQLAGDGIGANQTRWLDMIETPAGYSFGGVIDLLLRTRDTATKHYHARITLTATHTAVNATVAVVTNTLDYVPTVSVGMVGGFVEMTIYNGGALTLSIAARASGLLAVN